MADDRPTGADLRMFVVAAAAFWHFVVAAGAVVYWCLWFLMGGP